MAEATRLGLRLVGPPGTNKVMAAELSRLARRALSRLPPRPTRIPSGTLVYPWDPELAWLAAHYHRTSARVLWDLYESGASRLEPLYAELRAAVAADDRRWRWPGATISVDARNVEAFAAGPRQIVGTVKNAIIDGSGEAGVALSVDPRAADIWIQVRGHDETLTVSIDLAGRARHLRGYRREAGEAPLRETMAAAMLMLARWDSRREILLDPMAGSGTIAIEAALMARATPLWPDQSIAAAALPPFAELAAGPPPAPLFADTRAAVVALDVDPAMAPIAAANAARAGVDIAIATADLRDLDAAAVRAHAAGAGPDGLILANPPYGVRLRPERIEALYRELGRLSERLGWRLGILAAATEHVRAVGRRPRVEKPVRSGSLRLRFCLFEGGSKGVTIL